MLNTAQILDMAMSMLTDNTATARAKMLVWLNTGMQDIAAQRDWTFLRASVSLPLVNGYAAYPIDCEKPVSVTVGTDCIRLSDSMSDKDIAESRYGGNYGYRIATTTDGFTVYPAADSCDLKYTISVPTYADDTTDTVWPDFMLEVFWRLCVVRFYEFDFDERTPGAGQLYDRSVAMAKKRDNKTVPLPRREKRSILWRNS